MMGPPLQEEILLSSLTLNYPDQSCFHHSQWNIPSWAYALWRLFWCVWHVTWLIVSGIRTQNTAPDEEDGVKWFVYASNWTFLLTTFFCLMDFAMVVSEARKRSKDNDGDSIEQTEVPASNEKEEILFQGEFTLVEGIKTQSTPWPTKIQWCLFEAVNCTNLLCTIAFWASQYHDGDDIHADDVIFNIVNTVFVIANIMVTGIPVRILHFVYPAVFIAVYFLFNLVYFLADGTAIGGSDVTFRPLDWNEAYPTAFTIVVGLLVFVPVAHVIIFFSLFTLRLYLADKFGEKSTDCTNSELEQAYGGTYRKRGSTVVKIEADGATSEGGRRHNFEKSARVNEGFEMESENRR